MFQTQDLQSAARLFNDYQQQFHKAHQQFADDEDDGNAVYAYFHSSQKADDHWPVKTNKITYTGQRSTDANYRMSKERNCGR